MKHISSSLKDNFASSNSNRKSTLRETNVRRQRLIEKVMRADRQLLNEAKVTLLLEELNVDDLKKIREMQVKLDKIQRVAARSGEGAAPLAKAVAAARADVGKYTGGNFITKGIEALAKKIAGEGASTNPIVKCGLLVSVLEKGFNTLPDILKKQIDGYDEDADQSPLEQAAEDEKKPLAKETLQAFTPGDFFSKLKSFFGGAGMPYVDDEKAFAEGLLNVPAAGLTRLSDLISGSPISGDLRDTTTDIVKATKGAPGGGSSGGDADEAGGRSNVITTPRQLITRVATGETEKKLDAIDASDAPDKKKAAEKDAVVMKEMEGIAQTAGVDVKVVVAVVKALIRQKALKVESQEGRSTLKGVTLLKEDYVNALRLFVESGCRTRTWTRLLLEGSKEDAAWNELKSEIDDGKIVNENDIDKFLSSKGLARGAVRSFKQKHADEIRGLLKKAAPKGGAASRKPESREEGRGEDKEGQGQPADAGASVNQAEELTKQIEQMKNSLENYSKSSRDQKIQLSNMVKSAMMGDFGMLNEFQKLDLDEESSSLIKKRYNELSAVYRKISFDEPANDADVSEAWSVLRMTSNTIKEMLKGGKISPNKEILKQLKAGEDALKQANEKLAGKEAELKTSNAELEASKGIVKQLSADKEAASEFKKQIMAALKIDEKGFEEKVKAAGGVTEFIASVMASKPAAVEAAADAAEVSVKAPETSDKRQVLAKKLKDAAADLKDVDPTAIINVLNTLAGIKGVTITEVTASRRLLESWFGAKPRLGSVLLDHDTRKGRRTLQQVSQDFSRSKRVSTRYPHVLGAGRW